ncbi:hypothetical protein KFE80_04775 [bacterium SCSIO 12696]|nr:hypothetical protein KFE80_04775 [bacterium SCSIO 12696]
MKFKRPKTLMLGLIASMVLLVGILAIFDTPEGALVALLTLLLGLAAVIGLAFVAGTLMSLIRRALQRRRDR